MAQKLQKGSLPPLLRAGRGSGGGAKQQENHRGSPR